MIHGHGGYFLIPCDIDINLLSEPFIHIILKISENERMMIKRITAFNSRPEMEVGTLKELRVAC